MTNQKYYQKKGVIFLIFMGISLAACSEPNTMEPVNEEVASVSTTTEAITEAEVIEAQEAWAEGILSISDAYVNGEDYVAAAQAVLDNLYGYRDGIVLFKPTKAAEVPFRYTEEEALSYFVKGSIAEDEGFAINPWVNVRFGENRAIILNGETALAMGSYYFTAPDSDDEVKVEYSFGYYRDDEGNLRIQLHHSSVPFA